MSALNLQSSKQVLSHVPQAKGSVVTIGNFDGCHLGHQALVAKCKHLAAREHLLSIALTFEPAPEIFFSAAKEKRLFTVSQKQRAFAELGIDILVIEEFNQTLSQMSHTQFYEEILRNNLRATTLVVGNDFRFGSKRLGNVEILKQMHPYHLHVCEPMVFNDQVISSTRIRKDILAGEVQSAHLLLGRPYLLEGDIMPGQKRGRKLGFPTANLGDIEQAVPARGVYCGFVFLASDGLNRPQVMALPREKVPAVFNIGFQPTLNNANTQLQVEAHLLSGTYGSEALYGCRAGFYFTHRLRDEKKFSGLDDLREAIGKDIEQAKILLRDLKI